MSIINFLISPFYAQIKKSDEICSDLLLLIRSTKMFPKNV